MFQLLLAARTALPHLLHQLAVHVIPHQAGQHGFLHAPQGAAELCSSQWPAAVRRAVEQAGLAAHLRVVGKRILFDLLLN